MKTKNKSELNLLIILTIFVNELNFIIAILLSFKAAIVCRGIGEIFMITFHSVILFIIIANFSANFMIR